MGEVFLLMYLPIKMQFVLVLIFFITTCFLKDNKKERQTNPKEIHLYCYKTDNRVIFFYVLKKKSIGYERIVQLIKIIYSKQK